MEKSKESSPEQHSGTQRIVENLDNLLTDFVLEVSRPTRFGKFEKPGKDVTTIPDVILVADLNTASPTAGFIAPSLGYSHCVFLPAFQELSKEREELLVSSGANSGLLNYGQPGPDWTKNFLSHCNKLLELELGRPLDSLNVHISFTTRGDISEKEKAILGNHIENAGFKKSQDDTVLIFPTIDVVAIEIVRKYGNLNFNGDIQKKQPEKLKNGSNIFVIYYDGDVAEIQSYSISIWAAEKKSATNRLQLEDIIYGETVDCGKLVDEQFRRWLVDSFGNSLEKLSEKEIGPNGTIMNEFSALRRNYKAGRTDIYRLTLNLRNPPSAAPYDSMKHVCILHDDKVQSFFKSAIEALLNSLDNHHAGIGKAKKSIDQTIFAGPPGISPYIEDLVKDWGIGVGILTSDVAVFHSEVDNLDNVGRFLRFNPTQEMITEGVIRGNYPEIDSRKRSRYHYGFGSRHPFRIGDPEWSRWRDPWDNTDFCIATVTWHVRKNQLLDNLSTMQKTLLKDFRENDIHDFGLPVYKSESEEPPRWCYANQDNSLHPQVESVGKVSVSFTREDAERAQHKQCTDGIRRQRLPFLVEASVMPRLARIRVKARSDNGREIGQAMFRY